MRVDVNSAYAGLTHRPHVSLILATCDPYTLNNHLLHIKGEAKEHTCRKLMHSFCFLKDSIFEYLHYLSLYFVIQELLIEFGQGVVGAVVVQIQGVQHVPGRDTSFIHMELKEG